MRRGTATVHLVIDQVALHRGTVKVHLILDPVAFRVWLASRRAVSYWQGALLRGRLHGQHFFDVDRNFFDIAGPCPGGGSKMPAASEEALTLVYETY